LSEELFEAVLIVEDLADVMFESGHEVPMLPPIGADRLAVRRRLRRRQIHLFGIFLKPLDLFEAVIKERPAVFVRG
jgi:hypothetical protein